ncbi:hypothetical protein [Microbacterium invictum]|uniref:Uncharacterized protein n=1 Tax=Microbacterium invictum TaxID=515415 RepID=A0ABZ0VF13_9MICO|nr:hypothetical protein [Microbacterium invictum]WQB70387.1 hypothetical protein T9R20_00050 [Microbacterium invictum]
MPRRRELQDAADGITGHFVFDSAANPDWPLAYVAFAVRAGHGTTFSFDMLDGTVQPAAPEVADLARYLREDLTRHLPARRSDPEWVAAATLLLTAQADIQGARVPVRCQVAIRDDRGVVHTSTRRGAMTIPQWGLGRRLTQWVGQSFTTSRGSRKDGGERFPVL